MIELLSMPKRHSIKFVKSGKMSSGLGLPINSLPGWEQIPLNCKLPMLKCPDNQVIFSKNKIGQTFKQSKQDFDPSGRDRIPEYNPLHDSNLKTFYSNERNLKRLRQNGEITINNDVICTLKDFNAYRLQLHKSQLYYILQELNRVDIEQHDRMLIANAEAITARDHENLNARLNCYNEISARRDQLQQSQEMRYKKLWQRTLAKFEHVADYLQIQREFMDQRKVINNMRLQQHMEVSQDLQRKRLISLKKLLQFKNDRLQKNLRELAETQKTKLSERQMISWKKRLEERIAMQKKIKNLVAEMNMQREIFIQNHREKYKAMWAQIQREIAHRTKKMNRRSIILRQQRRTKRNKKKKMKAQDERHSITAHSICSTYQESFDKLLDVDLCKALHTVIDMQGDVTLPFHTDDPIYKAAKYILTQILSKFNKDLTNDIPLYHMVAEIFDRYFDEAKRVVTFRATQVIFNFRDQKKQKDDVYCSVIDSNESVNKRRRSTDVRNVSFHEWDRTIGMSSYEIHPHINLKCVINRTPTPPGSLASVRITANDDARGLTEKDADTDASRRHMEQLRMTSRCRNELIFVEHFIIKFKREMIVAIGRKVFNAIQLHFQDQKTEVRDDLLRLDRKFLVSEVTKGILSYAVNPLNYESALKLCSSALSSEIIASLQKYLLRDEKEVSCVDRPCPCVCPRKEQCVFWEDDCLSPLNANRIFTRCNM